MTSYAGYSSGGVGYSSGGLMSGFNPGDGESLPSLSSLYFVEATPKTDEMVQTAACMLCFLPNLARLFCFKSVFIHSSDALLM